MKKIILILIGIMLLSGTASAYGLYVNCSPKSIQVGETLKCSIESDFPAGMTFDMVFYQSQYTSTEIIRQSVTIQDSKVTQYKLFDTQGLPGGQYKMEIQFNGAEAPSLRSDSVTNQLITLIDRSNELTITSPVTQPIADALQISGSLKDGGNTGIQLEVRGPDGKVFGPQYIGSKTNARNEGIFSQKVSVYSPGSYDVTFSDHKGFIGIKTFLVTAPVTLAKTTIPVTTAQVVTTKPVTTAPTPWPTATKSPISPVIVIGAIGIIGLAAVMRKQ